MKELFKPYYPVNQGVDEYNLEAPGNRRRASSVTTVRPRTRERNTVRAPSCFGDRSSSVQQNDDTARVLATVRDPPPGRSGEESESYYTAPEGEITDLPPPTPPVPRSRPPKPRSIPSFQLDPASEDISEETELIFEPRNVIIAPVKVTFDLQGPGEVTMTPLLNSLTSCEDRTCESPTNMAAETVELGPLLHRVERHSTETMLPLRIETITGDEFEPIADLDQLH